MMGASQSTVNDTALENLVASHGHRLLRLLQRVLPEPGTAEDLWQDTWYSLLRSGWQPGADRDPWPLLRRAAITRVLDQRRRSQCRPVLITGSEVDPPAPGFAEGPTVDLSLLSHEQRACFILFYWEGLSVKEIAIELGAPENTIKTWMHRGRAKLRESLPAHEAKP